MGIIKEFDEVMDDIEGNSLEDFQTIWDAAMETCATLAEESGEDHLAAEYRDHYKSHE